MSDMTAAELAEFNEMNAHGFAHLMDIVAALDDLSEFEAMSQIAVEFVDQGAPREALAAMVASLAVHHCRRHRDCAHGKPS